MKTKNNNKKNETKQNVLSVIENLKEKILKLDFSQVCRIHRKMIESANKKMPEGYWLYSVIHEDHEDTWKRGWCESDYHIEIERTQRINKVFEWSTLLVKKGRFVKTYTAEKVFFIFLVRPETEEERQERLKKTAEMRLKQKCFSVDYYVDYNKKEKSWENWKKFVLKSDIIPSSLKEKIEKRWQTDRYAFRSALNPNNGIEGIKNFVAEKMQQQKI